MKRVRVAIALSIATLGSACSGAPPPIAGFPPGTQTASESKSVTKAYDFLNVMMDKYARGSATRLVQSFDGAPLKNFNDAVTHDDALFVDALPAEGRSDDIARSEVVGNAFREASTPLRR